MHLILPLLLTLPAQAQTATELPVVVDQLVTAITDGEYEAAADRAQATIDGMAAWTTPPDPHQFATLWQVLGAVGVYGERDALIAPALSQACAIDAEHFEERLGPKVQSQWEAACRHVQPDASLQVGPLRDDSALWIDGRPHQPNPAALAPGRHLVQVLTPEHEPFVAIVTLDADQRATLDTGIAQQPDDDGPAKAILTTTAGASLASAAVLGVLAYQAHGTFTTAQGLCTDPERTTPCSEATRDEALSYQSRRNTMGVAAGAAGGLGLVLGTAVVLRW